MNMDLDFQFDETNHIYTCRGEVVPGCTRVIDTGGWDTYANVREDILERKSAIGREVHRATALFDRGVLDWKSVDPRVIGYVRGWQHFCDATGFVPVLSEYRAICEVNGRKFGLTIDRQGLTGQRAGIRRGLDTTVEIKTTVKKARRHELQTAGYAIGLPKKGITSAIGRFLSRRRLIVYLKPDDDPDLHEADNREDFHIFMALLTVTEFKLREQKIESEKTWLEEKLSKRRM